MHSIDTIDDLVYDWIIRSGYQLTFSKLPTPLCAQAQSQASFLKRRSKVVKLIKSERIAEAIAFVEKEYQGVLRNQNRTPPIEIDSFKNIPTKSVDLFTCLFLLKLQNFVEIIRQRQIPSALNYVQSVLLPIVQENSNLENILQETLGVLVYTDPETSPMAWLFEKSRRYSALASLLNSCLYNLTTIFTTARIESFLKQVHGVDTVVKELNGFGNDLDDRKWSTIHSLLNNEEPIKKYIKTIKNE